jgi:haloacetate dehalogenase
MTLFPGFELNRIDTSGATINYIAAGKGEPVLLLHGYPETHVCWHRIAPELAKRYRVICADLRGYGDSSKPAGLPDHGPRHGRTHAETRARDLPSCRP